MSKPLKIVNASAGSGKTYTLVQEYLRIILHDKNPMKFRTILAMTFTNKAATEMKTRILQGLIRLAKAPHDKSAGDLAFLADTSKNLSIAPKLLEERSAAIVNAILHNYGQFSVMTIDKFTHRVIRSFARDLKLSMDFDVELDIRTLRKNVTDLLFDQVGRDEELTKLMMHYAQSNLNQDKSWNFASHVFDFSEQLFKDDASKAIGLLQNLSGADFLQVQEKLLEENAKTEAAITRNAKEALDLVHSKGLSAEDFHNKSNSIVGYFKRVYAGDYKQPSPTLQKTISEGKWGHPQSPSRATADSIGDLLAQYFKQVNELIDGPYRQCLVNEEILKNLNNLSLMNHLLKLVEGVKEEENILLISDFYKKIADVILKEPVPFIYEKIGSRYEHFLLDEFQDTSHLQWINMVPLVHNSLASGNANLIVGDGKQAIYRWRGGEVDQFTQLPHHIHNPGKIATLAEAEKLFSLLGEAQHLEKNFRSAPEIVDFNNRLFSTLGAQLPGYARIYSGSEQQVTKSFKGYVEAVLEEKPGDEKQLNYVLSVVRDALAKGYALKDICVLTRTNKRGSDVADFLSRNGIKVISPDSLFISKDLAVKFVFSVICSAAVPSDRNFKIKSLEHFATLKLHAEPGELVESWKDKLSAHSIETLFAALGFELQKPVAFHNLFEYVESVIGTFQLDLSGNPYLQFFLEEVHLFEKQNNPGLRDFIEWFNTKGATRSIASPEGANALQVMTIFKAKGLQFPVVICPFFDWPMNLSRQVSWVENEGAQLPAYFVSMTQKLADTELKDVYTNEQSRFLLDNLNLVYVAFTRAEVALFICGDSKASQTPLTNWLNDYFASTDTMTRDGNRYYRGEFENALPKNAEPVANYKVGFHAQVMDKPALSLKTADTLDIEDFDQRRTFGWGLHLLLSKMESKDDLDRELKICIEKGLIEKQDEQKIREAAVVLFADPAFNRYFPTGKVMNEKEIISANGQKLIPDKIIVNGDDVLVIDFKTGAKADAHVEQVLSYIRVLHEIGYKNVRGEIYYTSNKEIIKI